MSQADELSGGTILGKPRPVTDQRGGVSLHVEIDHERVSEFCRRNPIARLAFFGSVLRDDFGPVTAAIKAADRAAFEAAYDWMVRRANELHVEFGKAFLVWKTPELPPDDLDLTAGMPRHS